MQKLAGLLVLSQVARAQEFSLLRRISELFEQPQDFFNEETNVTQPIIGFEARRGGGRQPPKKKSQKMLNMFVSFSLVTEYGCWCNFMDRLPYRGTPQDDLDRFCQKRVQNFDCLAMDYGESCSVQSDYVDVMKKLPNPFGPKQDYVTHCTKANKNNPCGAMACAIDADFMRSVFNYLNRYQVSRHLMAMNDFTGEVCKIVPAKTDNSADRMVDVDYDEADQSYKSDGDRNGRKDRPVKRETCCGEYPNRSIFMKRVNKKCCGVTTYNTDMYDCCADNSIQLIGAC